MRTLNPYFEKTALEPLKLRRVTSRTFGSLAFISTSTKYYKMYMCKGKTTHRKISLPHVHVANLSPPPLEKKEVIFIWCIVYCAVPVVCVCVCVRVSIFNFILKYKKKKTMRFVFFDFLLNCCLDFPLQTLSNFIPQLLETRQEWTRMNFFHFIFFFKLVNFLDVCYFCCHGEVEGDERGKKCCCVLWLP